MRHVGNASSIHSAGRKARAIVEDSRKALAALCHTDSKNVIFTSGATEANNAVLRHFSDVSVIASGIEHPSVLEAAPNAARIPVLPNGVIDLEGLERLVHAKSPALVSAMMVNNETGVIQPVEDIARIVKKAGAKFHCDAVQAAGRIPLDFHAAGCDYMTLSAHKMGGPMGVGALLVAKGAPPVKLIYGGGQERRQRAGTENVAGIAGMGAAAKNADIDRYQKLALLRDRLETEISGITVFGQDAPRVANTTCFALCGVAADTQLMALDLAGIAVSSGSACSSGSVKASHVLEAMGVDSDLAGCALRISLGWTNTAADIETFIKTYNKLKETWQR